MSRNRAKRSFDWIALARQSAERAKFREIFFHPLVGHTFGRGSEVSPSLLINFRRVTFAEIAPDAYLGIFVEAFESEWRDRLLRSNPPMEYAENPAFIFYIANVDCMRPRPWVPFSPSDHDVAAVRDWLDRAFAYAKRLPSSMHSLVAAIEANQIADHDVEAYLGHPVKVRGFVEWLRRTHGVELGDRLLPLLSDRTDPYDVRVMLGTG